MNPISALLALAVTLAALALTACQSSPFEGPSRVPTNPDEGAGPGAFSDPMVDRQLIDDNEPDEDPMIGEPVDP